MADRCDIEADCDIVRISTVCAQALREKHGASGLVASEAEG